MKHFRVSSALGASFLLLSLGVSDAAAGSVKVLRVEPTDGVKAYYDKVVAEFEASRPGTQVRFEYIANEAYKQKLTTLLQSDQKPDLIFSWAGGVLRQQIEAGVLQDISAKMTADWAGSLAPAGVAAFTVDGKVYGAPTETNEVEFWINLPLAKKAGIDPAVIKTWDDFLAAVKKAKDAGITPIVVGGKDKWPLHFYYGYLMVREAGAEGMTSATSGKGDGFNAPPFVKAGEDFKQLIDLQPFQSGFMDTTAEQGYGLFGDGKGVFQLMGDWFYNTSKQNSVSGKGISDGDLATIRFPVVPGGAGKPSDTFGGLNGFAVVKGASPEAVDFLRFLTSVEQQKQAAAKGLFIPVANGAGQALTNPFFKAMSEAVANSSFHQIFLDQALGSDVGATMNDASADLAQAATTPEDAAASVQDAASR